MDNKTILYVPWSVRTDGESLMYDMTIPTEKEAKPLIFHEFLRLDPDDPDQIAHFAGRWGVLGICSQHGMPVGHPLRTYMSAGPCEPAHVKLDGVPWFAEPLSKWRRIALKSAMLIRLARKIEQLDPGEQAEWEMIQGHLDLIYLPESKPERRNLNSSRSSLGLAIQDWLEIGRVIPRFGWDYKDENWILRHDIPSGPWGLFGWLALSLAIEIRGGRFAVCSNCGREYHVARLPSAGRPNYCPSEECRRALWRNNKRKHALG
jgi:hypothetical protein